MKYKAFAQPAWAINETVYRGVDKRSLSLDF